jgi:PAS domain S-box-containing protein
MKLKMSTRFTGILAAVMLFLCPAVSLHALDPHKRITQYVHDSWDSAHGLPHNTVYSVVQTGDGYIWLATEEGLVRFDGVRFVVFDKQKIKEFSSNSTWFLYEDRSGDLRIGTNGGGMLSYDSKTHRFSALNKAQGLPHHTVRTICESKDGSLWVGTEGGLARVKDGELSLYTTQQGLLHDRIRTICADRENWLWIGTQNGLNRMDTKSGTIYKYTTNEGLAHNTVNFIYMDRMGKVWVSTNNGVNYFTGLNAADKREKNGFTIKHFMAGKSVWPVLEDRDGNLWLGTYGEGLYRMNIPDREDTAPTVAAFTVKDGLTGKLVWSLYEDREGNLWVGTDNGGLNRLRDGKFRTYTNREGLSGDRLWTIFEDRQNRLWIGANDNILNFLERHNNEYGAFDIRVYNPGQQLKRGSIWSIREDRAGGLWIGTEGNGLGRLDALHDNNTYSLTTYTTKQGLSDNNVAAIWPGNDGLWIGTYGGGVNLFKNGSFSVFNEKQGLSNNYVISILEDRQGIVWAGTEDGGLNRLDPAKKDGIITVYTHRKNGLTDDYILSLYEDDYGSLWVGTYNGLNRLKNGKIDTVTIKDGLYDDIAYVILEDDRGDFWMSCNKGVYRVSKTQLNDFCDGKISRIHCDFYDDKDGMKSKECYGTTQPAGWKSRDGKLWFPTARGVAMIDPERIKFNRLPPPVAIESVTADEKHLYLHAPESESPRFPAGTQRLEIRYTAMSFPVPERVRFKCKLEGFDKEWRSMGTRRTAYYTKLSPGMYTFRVRACNNDGAWNETGASVSFYKEPYFYETWWAYLLGTLGALFLGFSVYRLSVRQLTRRKSALEKLVKERTLQLEETNKNLEKLSIVARETDNAVMIMDAQGNLEWLNEGAHKTYGYTFEQFTSEKGKNITEVSAHPGIEKLLANFIEKPEPLRYESLYKTRTGKTIWTQVTWTPVLDSTGKLKKIVAIASDITRLKEQHAQILKQSKKLQNAIKVAKDKQAAADAANQAKSDFLARMSHEIRTPMNAIMGFTDILKESTLNPEQLDYINTISRSSQALSGLLNDILDFSRVEAGELILEMQDFNLKESISEVCNIMDHRLRQKPVTLTCYIDVHVPSYFRGDAGRFRQVLFNVLGNAVKFTEEGEIDFSIEKEKETRKKIMLHCVVRDTGPGIPANKLGNIFEAFYQMDRYHTREYEGSGLGLAIARQIARVMKGNVWAESTEGKGSTFHFTAWMEKSAKETVETTQPLETSRQPEAPHILLAEDNPVNRKLIQFMLTKAGYRLTTANDGQEAADAFNAAEGSFDLVLMDIQMPRMDGLEATRIIREKDEHIPIIALTAQAMKGDREKCLDAGMDDYISKPIKKDIVLSVLEKWLKPIFP